MDYQRERRRFRHLLRCTAELGEQHRDQGAAAQVSASCTASAETSIRPLTRNQLKRFIRDGFIVLQVDGVPDGFHEQLYAKALGMSEDARHAENSSKIKLSEGGRITAEGKRSDWSTLSEDFETLLDTPCIRGAAVTLAGPGCLLPSVGAPSPLTANPFDQQFHKDGTGTAVREPYMRSIGAWYYPHETTVIMGPTAVVPGTHVFGIDREGFPHSEERIDLRMTPPKSREDWQKELLSWNGHALSIFGHLGVDPATGDLPVPERERRIADFKHMFGDPTLKEHKLTVPAGSVVIKHNDIVHRRCRSGEDGVTDDGVEWRPMFGFNWTRTVEPTPGSLILAADSDNDDATADPFALTAEEASYPESAAKVAVWESVLSWIEGNGPVTPTGVAAAQGTSKSDVKKLGHIVQTSKSETERVGTAYTLGSIIRQSGLIGDTATEYLLRCMVDAKECVRRAATWGIGSGGSAVVPELLTLLVDEHSSLPPVVQQGIRTNAAYALRVAAEAVDQHTVDALETAMSACELQLANKVAELSPHEREALKLSHNRGPRGWDGNMYSCVVEMDHEVHELRKTMATSLLALGQLGRIAMTELNCARIVSTLAPLIAVDNPFLTDSLARRGHLPCIDLTSSFWCCVLYAGHPQLALRIWKILDRMHREYVDEAAIFPTHLSSGLIHSHADRALCTMLCPNATSADIDMAVRADQQRETGRGLGLAALALQRLQKNGAKTAAARLVLKHAEAA